MKPPAIRVPSDDYTVEVDGVLYHPHEGEALQIIGRPTIAEKATYKAFERVTVELDAARGEPDERARITAIMERHYDEMCAQVASRVAAWDWTDDGGRPLPPLDGTAEPFTRLTADELYYVLQVCQSEAPAERKNGSSSLPTSSSATEPAPSRKSSSTARNRSKAS